VTVAPTQQALYADIDLDLSWSERDLPERERTKHVHRLHPYLGKFIPQLVEVLLGRYFASRQHVLDPFAGSGTTLVQALESGLDATGADIAAFNVLLMQVKTRPYNLFTLEHELRDACSRMEAFGGTAPRSASRYVRDWYAPAAAPSTSTEWRPTAFSSRATTPRSTMSRAAVRCASSSRSPRLTAATTP